MVNNKDYEPFFYDDYTIFYNGYTIQSTTDLFKEQNIADWTAYLEKYDKKIVEYYLYDNEVKEILAREEDPDSGLKQYEFKYDLGENNEKKLKFIWFLMFSKGIETYSNQTYN